MEAGRELDMLVAEKVMGVAVKDWPTGRELGLSSAIAAMALSKEQERRIPRYSTDIAAAWEVVERVGLFTKKMLVLAHDGENWVVCEEVNPAGPQTVTGRANTAPHAICLAALKAAGAN